MDQESKSLQVVQWIMDKAISGVPPLCPAEDLAREYLADPGYADDAARVERLIRRESRKNFGTGFVTGFGGLLTMPVTIPASMGASWVIQARMVAAIATIYGHDLKDPRIRTLVMLSLVSNAVKEVCKDFGVASIERMTGQLLTRVNREIGQRLIARTAKRGVSRLVPVVGGLVSGGIDGYACRQVGLVARDLFSRKNPVEDIPGGKTAKERKSDKGQESDSGAEASFEPEPRPRQQARKGARSPKSRKTGNFN